MPFWSLEGSDWSGVSSLLYSSVRRRGRLRRGRNSRRCRCSGLSMLLRPRLMRAAVTDSAPHAVIKPSKACFACGPRVPHRPRPVVREGVCCHNANEEYGLTSVEFDEASDAGVFPFDDEHFTDQDANEPDHHPGYQPHGTHRDAFGDKTVSGREHEAASCRIRDRNPKQTQPANEQERKRTKSGRDRS